MADGIHALEGFDYQATVILELMLQHFLEHPEGQLRPEGEDDVVLRWTRDGAEQFLFVQVKKPKVSESGEPTAVAWQLPAVARELMAATVRRLREYGGRQLWVLGDDIEPRIRALLAAGANARERERASYMLLLHLLARNATEVTSGLSRAANMRLARWSPPPSSGGGFEEHLSATCRGFERELEDFGVVEAKRSDYRQALYALDRDLPGLLARIEVRDAYGSEAEVRERVALLLQDHHSLARSVIDHTLLRNLRGFINDIAKQRGRWVTRTELVLELISVWPEMTPLRLPPPHERGYVRRPSVIRELQGALSGGMVECLGVSGSGKTNIAAELNRESGETPCFYVEVHQQTRFRNVLAAVAYGLRRYGELEPFHQVTLQGLSEEEVLGRCAKAFTSVARDALVIVDFVEGECNDTFTHDLAHFARELSPGHVRWAFFAQRSPLGGLTSLEQRQLKIGTYNLPGLSFEELVALSAALNRDFDSDQLREVFVRMTARRQSGLIPSLAKVLLRSVEPGQLMEVAQLPAEQIVSAVEQRRFDTLPPHLRSAALRLVCLALPFTLTEAEAMFPRESIRAAIAMLLSLGLLRPLGDGQLEMHETIRRGMERLLPPAFKLETHALLAAWYEQTDALPAHVFHLEQAGHPAEAREKALAAFRARRHLPALFGYLRAHGLLPVDDMVAWLEEGLSSEDYFVVRSLEALAQPAIGRRLLSYVRAHPEKFDADSHWAWKLSEVILASEPALVRELAEFALEPSARHKGDSSRLESVRLAASWQLTAPADTVLLPLFEERSDAEKRALVPLLLAHPGRNALQRVLAYMAEHRWPLRGRQYPQSDTVKLALRTTAQVEDFLAALPRQSVERMLVDRSARLEPFDEYVWNARSLLQPVAREVLSRDVQDGVLLENAIRVSIHLADEGVSSLTENLLQLSGPAQTLVLALPVFLDVPGGLAWYEAQLLEPREPMESRGAVLPLLALLGADLDRLLTQVLATAAAEHAASWKRAFLLQLSLRPFKSAVGILRELWTSDEPAIQKLVGDVIPHVNRLQGPEVTDALIAALGSPTPRIRLLACMALARRRSRRALGPLLAVVNQDAEPAVQRQAAVAALASGPRSADDVPSLLEGSLDEIPYTMAVGRLRVVEQGTRLVQLALDRALPWRARRAAILASSHLPFEAALQSIVPAILTEPAPLPVDNASALGHSVLAVIASPEEHDAFQVRLRRGQAGFVACFGPMYDDFVKASFPSPPLLNGTQAATWLWERLQQLGWRENASALRRVSDELHVPILHAAALRGLRLHSRAEELERVLAGASTEWLAARALMERFKIRPQNVDLDRIDQLIRAGPFSASPTLRNLLPKVVSRVTRQDAPMPASADSKLATPHLTFDRMRELIGTKGVTVPPDAVAEIASDEELRWLVRELDPGNDSIPMPPEKPLHGLSLTGTDFSLSSDGGIRWDDNNRDARWKLRPLVSAANRLGLEIPWHAASISDDLYRERFLHALAAHGDANRIFSLLEQHQELILPSLDGRLASRLSALMDERILPFVSRYLNAGPPRVLEALCTLVARILDDRIVPILARLLERWVTTTRRLGPKPSVDDSVPLARALEVLADHPRFEEVPNWDDQLLDLLGPKMEFFRRKDLVRIVRRSPKAYVSVETLLQNARSFEHWWEDEVDVLDGAADELFARVLVLCLPAVNPPP